MEIVDRLRALRAASGRLLLGLDFDGTLAPIVPRPEDAALPADTRQLLQRLAARTDTLVALISGRALHDLRERAGMDDVYYAGNHGLEIEGPAVHRIHDTAVAARERLGNLARRLTDSVGTIPGAIVEDKGLTLSVHYRLVTDPEQARHVRDATHEIAAQEDGLRITDGRKVVEIRPDVDWHKGRALRFLRETLTADCPDAPAVFIGDDRTDEDAFRELRGDDCGIVVGDAPVDTAARARLESTLHVVDFLRALA